MSVCPLTSWLRGQGVYGGHEGQTSRVQKLLVLVNLRGDGTRFPQEFVCAFRSTDFLISPCYCGVFSSWRITALSALGRSLYLFIRRLLKLFGARVSH